MEGVQLFVPMDRRRALGCAGALPERASGVVLFADVSGFSMLSAALARDLGPQRGAESLTGHLDRVIGTLAAAVHRFHGSVIGFSGDGITCWFDDSDAADDASARAAACALTMQQVVAALPSIATPSQERIEFGIKVALAAGPVRRLLVGDDDIQKLEVLSGATLTRMADAANNASRGEVVASREVIDRLDAASAAGIWRPSPAGPHLAVIEGLETHIADSPWSEVVDLADEPARPWIPLPVYERVHLRQGEFVADLRPVVSMFVRFTGIDYDDDAHAGSKLDAYVRWVQATIDHYGGHVLQLSVDDKGSYLYIVFGALQAYADATQRAVSAACQVRALPEDLSFIRALQIGISRGRVYSGTYGGPERRAYSVLGHEVNIAARLMQLAAVGEILISERMAAAAEAEFALDDRGEVILKGIGQAFRAFAVIGRKVESKAATKPSQAGPRLVGRDEHMEELTRHLEAARSGGSATVIVEGPAGIGKSRLIDGFIERTRHEVPVYVGAADPIERSAAYHLWRGVFIELLDLGSSDTSRDTPIAGRVDAGVRSFATDRTHLTPLLGSVLGISLPDTPLTAEMTGKVRADNTNDLLVDILKAAARRAPLVIILEDVHWMDSASTALLGRVAREVTPLLVVITTRPSPQPPSEEYAALLQAPEVHQVGLDSLSRPATQALLCQRLGVEAVPDAVVDLIFGKSDGHPFFSEVIANALLEAGLIQVRGGVCYLSPGTTLDSFQAPDTIEGVITSRIDSLDSAEQLTLKVASVIGRSFGFGMLRHIHPVEQQEPVLLDQLGNLTRIELLLQNLDSQLEYLFKHVITQEVAYGLLLYRQRRELHRRVAQWYEDNAGDDLSIHYPRLAHHWSRAAHGEVADLAALEKALDYLDKAGEQALNAHANEEAIRFFTDALELDAARPRSDDRAVRARAVRSCDMRVPRWHHRLSLAYQGLGNLARCREHAEQGLTLLGRPIPSNPVRLSLGVLGQVALRLAATVRNQPVAGRHGPQEWRETMRQEADLYIPLARVTYHTNDALASMYVNTTKLNLMERLGPSPELAESYGSIGVTLGFFQMHRRADAYVRRGVEIARTANNNRGLVTAHVISAAYLIGVGQWRRVQDHLEEGRRLCEALGDHQQWGDCVAIMADAAFLEGDMTRAMALYDELMSAARRRNNHLQELWAIRGKATAALRDGKADDAVRLLRHAVVLLEDTTDHPTRIDMHGLLAAALLGCGEWKEADRSARQAAALIAKASPPTAYPQYLGYAAVAETFIELLRQAHEGTRSAEIAADVGKQAKQALRNLHTYGRFFAIGRPQAWRHQGVHEELAGNRKKAQRSWEKGLASTVALGIPYEQCMLHYLLARSLPVDDPTRDRHLAQARAAACALQSACPTEMIETVIRGQ